MPGSPGGRDPASAANPVGHEAERTVRTVGKPGYVRISGIGHCVAPVTEATSFNAAGRASLAALTHRVLLGIALVTAWAGFIGG